MNNLTMYLALYDLKYGNYTYQNPERKHFKKSGGYFYMKVVEIATAFFVVFTRK